ncbi:kinase-like domain-containing protein [Syncephalis fuscata]|nr:kinase-like domain-containing protein [Syncephalis fuscata]
MAFVEYNQETAFLKCPTRPDSFRRENKAFELIEAAQPDKYGVGNNIVRRLHSFSREGIECFVLSLGGDVTLKEYASSNGINYDGDTLAPLIGQLLKAVRFLHDHAGIVHGDIKPDNILVRLTSPPQITLIDFDLSYVKGERILTTGLSHAPAYVPPEGLSDEYPEHEDKHDVWALGVTIFNVLTGKDILENRINPIMNVKVVLASQKRRSSSFKAFRKALSGDFKKAQNDDFKDNLTYKQAIKEMQLCLQTTPALRLSLAEIDAKKNEPIETKKL